MGMGEVRILPGVPLRKALHEGVRRRSFPGGRTCSWKGFSKPGRCFHAPDSSTPTERVDSLLLSGYKFQHHLGVSQGPGDTVLGLGYRVSMQRPAEESPLPNVSTASQLTSNADSSLPLPVR